MFSFLSACREERDGAAHPPRRLHHPGAGLLQPQGARSRSQNSPGSLPTLQDPFLCRKREHEWQEAAALPERHREPEPSQGLCKYSLPKRSETGFTLNYQALRNVLLPFLFPINYFSNNPLTALTTSAINSPVLRESYYLFENSLRFLVALHITCTIRRKQEGSHTGKCS